MSFNSAVEVSVIVPVYNVAPFLHRCLDSLLNQTFDSYEIILIDDGSTDDSGIICDEYAENNSMIRLLRKPNKGLSSARNAGLELASGRFISFVDSDDYVDSNYIKKTL